MKRFSLKIALICLVLPACGGDHSQLIQQKVAEAVAKTREKKAAECRTLLLTEAEKIVDSLLYEEAKSGLTDSLKRARPFRPMKPPAIPPLDSGGVRPIFKERVKNKL